MRFGNCAPGGACGAQPAENELALAQHARAERAYCGLWDVVPFHVFDVAAAIANEVVMSHELRVEACGAAFHGDFANETGFNQVTEVVVGSGAGGARIDAIDGVVNLGGCGMSVVFEKERHDGVALGRAAKAAAVEGTQNHLRFHERFRLCLN